MAMDKSYRSIDGRSIVQGESREYRYGYDKEQESLLQKQYQMIISMLADYKLKNESIFLNMVDATIRRYANDGINISKEELLRDINRELYKRELVDDEFELDDENRKAR